MMKCSFCELPLACKQCGKLFQPRQEATLVAAYQPDMEISCPECHAVLACKSCGFIYGEEAEEPGQ
jgi:DNA-directed RNA polymerase subunit RPC12/RpoP